MNKETKAKVLNIYDNLRSDDRYKVLVAASKRMARKDLKGVNASDAIDNEICSMYEECGGDLLAATKKLRKKDTDDSGLYDDRTVTLDSL